MPTFLQDFLDKNKSTLLLYLSTFFCEKITRKNNFSSKTATVEHSFLIKNSLKFFSSRSKVWIWRDKKRRIAKLICHPNPYLAISLFREIHGALMPLLSYPFISTTIIKKRQREISEKRQREKAKRRNF